MFRGQILSRIGKNRFFANFCSLGNGERPSVNSVAGISLLKSEPVSSDKLSPGREHVISYLVNSCGLTLEKAVSASSRLHFVSPDKPNDVLLFLEKHGFSKPQITELVSRRPKLLLSNPEKSLLPKIEFFLHSAGFSETDMVKTFVKYPRYLTRSVEKLFAPVYEYLEDVVGSRKAGILLSRGSWIFDRGLHKKLIDNVAFLRELEVPERSIQYALYHYPHVVTRDLESFKKLVSEVQGMGFNPLKMSFVVAMHSRTGKSSRGIWERCYETYSSWGWSKDDIHLAFRKYPNCMLLSEKKISRFLDLVVNKMGRDSRSIAQIPNVIAYSMEKRIIPRYSVLRHLFLNGFVEKDWSLASVIYPAEQKFLEKYVKQYLKEQPQLLSIYKGETNCGF
ncbi:Mitochondrial transcription termination factor family protein [Dorcoceras hygrometricum]|uniref:Mitochondrial transcription termination factor family protein n=1 Tax=Dorcoceras hygrometricum TaxID=472368 RepID=A0A2Z7D723_9LAMI|nr:Mitochondrial transcription termination factor family protein [Dorcoceras hygrometricum]